MSEIRVTYSGLISLLGGIITLVATSIFAILVARTLAPNEYGSWGLINSIILYVVMVGPITSFWTTREISRGNSIGKTAITGAGLLACISLAVYLVISLFIGNTTEIRLNDLIFASLLIPINLLLSTLAAIALGKIPQALGYGNLAFGISQVPMGYLFVVMLNMGIPGVILSIGISQLVNIFILTIFVRNSIKKSIQYDFLKKCFRLFWIPSFPSLPIIIESLDATIFLIITKSTYALGFWTAAVTFASMINHSGLISKGVYPKLLGNKNRDYFNENIIHLLFFGILFTLVTITFAKPAIFILNPVYESGYPLVIFFSLYLFLNLLVSVFQLSLTGIENIDTKINATFRDYVKSKLFLIPSIRLIQSILYVSSISVLFILFNSKISEIDLLQIWLGSLVIIQIPFFIYFYNLTVKNFQIKLLKPLVKYLFAASISFSVLYMIHDKMITYNNNPFSMIPSLIIPFILLISIYVAISLIIDLHARNLFKSILKEIKSRF